MNAKRTRNSDKVFKPSDFFRNPYDKRKATLTDEERASLIDRSKKSGKRRHRHD